MDVQDSNPALAALRYRAKNAVAGLDLALGHADRQLPDHTAAAVCAWGLEIAGAGQAFLAACSDPDPDDEGRPDLRPVG
jgi:hypothetical protein